jgi:hypothetical protein
MHPIDLNHLRHILPQLSVMLVGVFHLLKVLIEQLEQIIIKAIDAARAVLKKYRAMLEEWRRAPRKVGR